MQAILRTLRFTGFTLLEYLRSARILLELIAAATFWYIFLRRSGQSIDAEYFFTVTGVFAPALTLYTMSAVIGLGDRPQGYVLLVRKLNRAQYLIGLFASALAIVSGVYGLVCLTSAFLNPPTNLTLAGWGLGTLPLLLNAALLSALLLMLSPLVFSPGWRLFVLGLIALAFSGSFISGPFLDSLPVTVIDVLRAVQAVLGAPLVPAFYGFQLSMTRDYSTIAAPVNLLAQLMLLISLLGLAIYAFSRRDLIFSAQ